MLDLNAEAMPGTQVVLLPRCARWYRMLTIPNCFHYFVRGIVRGPWNSEFSIVAAKLESQGLPPIQKSRVGKRWEHLNSVIHTSSFDGFLSPQEYCVHMSIYSSKTGMTLSVNCSKRFDQSDDIGLYLASHTDEI